jgi:3-oxoadipate enol-lactonase
MPRLNFIKQGSGPAIVLCHALGCDLGMWDEVAAQLVPGYTVLRYDQRGHGKSDVVAGPYGIEDMADDAAELIARELPGEVHFVGLSMGGMVAQQLAVRHPELVTSIVVANSCSYYDEAARGLWRSRIDTVRREGVPAIAEAAMQRWFTPRFRQDPQGARRVAALRAVLEACDREAYAAACDAISRIDFRLSNPRIACPALVIAGTRDEGTPLEMGVAICKSISGAELATLDAAHLSAVERPVQFAALVAGFIRSH